MTAAAAVEDVVSGKARWCVICADCLEVMPTIERVDHVITDPPYSKHVHTRQRRQTFPDGHTAPSRKIRVASLGFDHLDARTRRGFAREAARLAAGWVLAFSDFESAHLLRRSFEAAGLRHWRVGAWDKRETGAPQFNGCGPAQWGEAIEIAHSAAPLEWNSRGARGVWRHMTEIARGGGADVKVSADDRHTTQKPITLMCELVEDFTNDNDLVLDPFAGRGTTGAACIRLGRRFIGIEKNPKEAQLANDRLRAESQLSTAAAARAGQLPLLASGGGK